jgi:ABC-type uncharacterized transport system permease subunit
MKHHDETQEWVECPDEHADEWEVRCQQAIVAAGLRCQICNRRGNLLFHNRTDSKSGLDLSDVLALCAECYELAQMRKQLQGRSVSFRILTNAVLFLIIALTVLALFTLSPLVVLCVFFACGYLALLLEAVFMRFKA